MKFLDFIYFILYKAYLKGNKDKLGALFISSLWVSLIQMPWVCISLMSLEYYFEEKYFKFLDKFPGFAFLLILLVILNNIYLGFGDRKKKILDRFSFSESKEIFYLFLMGIGFIISFVLISIMGALRKEMFGQ